MAVEFWQFGPPPSGRGGQTSTLTSPAAGPATPCPCQWKATATTMMRLRLPSRTTPQGRGQGRGQAPRAQGIRAYILVREVHFGVEQITPTPREGPWPPSDLPRWCPTTPALRKCPQNPASPPPWGLPRLFLPGRATLSLVTVEATCWPSPNLGVSRCEGGDRHPQELMTSSRNPSLVEADAEQRARLPGLTSSSCTPR